VEIKSTLKSTENAQAIPKNFSFTANASNNETLGQNWNYETAFDASAWKSITYGNNRYVAVSNSGTTRVMYSDDGKVWQAATATGVDANAWESVTFGNGRFVAVTSTTETGNQVMYSDDGKVWTGAAVAIVNGWSSVTYGGGMFLAVGAISKVMYSNNGVNWTSGTTLSSAWIAVTYGNGRFVAVSPFGFIMYSLDGKSWSSSSVGTASSWKSVTYGNGGFVAVAGSGAGSRIMHSTDGIEWSYSSLIDSNQWESVSYGNGTYVAVALTNKVAFSRDRNTWTYSTTDALGSGRGVTYGNGQFVAVSNMGQKRVLRTVAPFTVSSVTPAANATNIAANATISLTFSEAADASTVTTANITVRGQQSGTLAGTWIVNGAEATFTPTEEFLAGEVIHVEAGTAVKSTGGGQLIRFAFSFTVIPANNEALGQNWDSVTGAESDAWSSITFGNGRFVAVAPSGTNRIMYSDDTETWTPVLVTEQANLFSVTYGGGKYVAVSGDGSGRLIFSTNGESWSSATTLVPGVRQSVTYGNGLFVAVSNAGTNRVMYSADGINWEVAMAPEANPWYSVTYGNGQFVAVAVTGTNRIMYSDDGKNWTAGASVVLRQWQSVAYGNGRFIAVNSEITNKVIYSIDGINWVETSTPESSALNSIVFGNSRFIAVGLNSKNKVIRTSVPFSVSSVTPAANATKVAINAPIRVKFNQPIVAGTFTGITIKQGSTTLSGVTASVSDSTLTLAHPAFENGKTYVVDVLAGAVKSASNQESSAVNFSFRVIQSALVPIAFSPANGATQVPLDATLSIKFDQKLYQHPDANSLGEVNIITDGTSYGTPVSIQDSMLTINFDTSKFVAGKSVTIQISPFNVYVVNEDGLGFDAFTWSFTSYVDAPTLVRTIPANNGTKVEVGDEIIFRYDREFILVDQSKIIFTQGATVLQQRTDYTVDTDGNDLVITLEDDLDYFTTYSISVGAGAIRDN